TEKPMPPAIRRLPALALLATAMLPVAGASVHAAPAGAPNVVIVLLDDVGLGAARTFGGDAQTPTLDAPAQAGLRYDRFHTTAICSPTRASLLSGRNAHAVGIGAVMNSVDERPGYNGEHARDAATLAEILRANG